MNERIRKLYEESLIRENTVDNDGKPMLAIKQDPAKFAELIVRECATIAESKLLKNLRWCETHQLSYNEGLRHGVSEFKKHFGVE